MKLYFGIVFMLVGLTWAAQVDDNGQPGCKTQTELQVSNYRNTWDPTRFWICQQLGQPAVASKCPGGTGWLDSQKSCVDWAEWEWEVPEHPPSKP